jgi:hypothetical protein
MMSSALEPWSEPLTGGFAELRARYERDGYLKIDSLTNAADVATIRALLEPLFEKFDSLGQNAVDLAGPRDPSTPPRQPEINDALKFVPALRKTLAYQRCRDLARGLLGVPVGCIFDHAIYKPPHNAVATPWHQDAVYIQGAIPRALNFWIPLQEATIENGCMWYLPGSHLNGLLPHRVAFERPGGETGYTKGKSFVLEGVDESKAVACPVPVGGVTVHGPLNAHYAGPNTTDDWRRAWILHFGAYGKLRSQLDPKSLTAKLRTLTHH